MSWGGRRVQGCGEKGDKTLEAGRGNRGADLDWVGTPYPALPAVDSCGPTARRDPLLRAALGVLWRVPNNAPGGVSLQSSPEA